MDLKRSKSHAKPQSSPSKKGLFFLSDLASLREKNNIARKAAKKSQQTLFLSDLASLRENNSLLHTGTPKRKAKEGDKSPYYEELFLLFICVAACPLSVDNPLKSSLNF